MKTIDKFILKSYLGPMFVTFFIVMFILLMNILWRYIDELVGKGLPTRTILELMFYASGNMIPLGLPLATLLAAIMTLGNLGENYELLALKSAGISLPRILSPIVIVAVLISFSSFFVMNNFVPYSYQKTSNLLYDIRQQKQEIEFKDGVFFNGIPRISIRVGKQNPKNKQLTDVLIYDTRENGATKTIVADSGYINLSKDRRYLKVRLFKGQTYEENRNYEWYKTPKLRHHIFDYQEIVLELEGFDFKKSGNEMFGNESGSKNIQELGYDIDSLEKVVQTNVSDMNTIILRDYLLRSDTSEMHYYTSDSVAKAKHFAFVAGPNFDTLNIERKTVIMTNAAARLSDMKFYISSEHENVRATTIQYYKSLIDWHKKIALPVSILIFFLIGAPLGAIIRKGGLGTPIVISVMFFVIYYIITITGEKMVSDGAWPPLVGIWLSSIILFPLAIFLTYKSATDSGLLDVEWYAIKIKATKNTLQKLYNKVKLK